jgi:hypothetical protein
LGIYIHLILVLIVSSTMVQTRDKPFFLTLVGALLLVEYYCTNIILKFLLDAKM